jgi:hypothetical protein
MPPDLTLDKPGNLPTPCFARCCTNLVMNSDCFPERDKPAGLCNVFCE